MQGSGGRGSETLSEKLGGDISVQGTWVGSSHSRVPVCRRWGRAWQGRTPTAGPQPCLTAIQQLVLHTVALQCPLTLRLLPAHFQRRGPQG